MRVAKRGAEAIKNVSNEVRAAAEEARSAAAVVASSSSSSSGGFRASSRELFVEEFRKLCDFMTTLREEGGESLTAGETLAIRGSLRCLLLDLARDDDLYIHSSRRVHMVGRPREVRLSLCLMFPATLCFAVCLAPAVLHCAYLVT